jgi:hypothetical protein
MLRFMLIVLRKNKADNQAHHSKHQYPSMLIYVKGYVKQFKTDIVLYFNRLKIS